MKKVLVVDNHPVMLKFMADLLIKKGYKVKTAKDSLSALDILKTYLPEVIFIDLIMPNISGEKLCRIIRSMPKLKNSYLIILSAVAAEKAIDFANLGANACIAKGPFNEMGKHVLAVLDQADPETCPGFSKKIIGLETIHEREITEELLSSRRHSEIILNNISEGILELTLKAQIVFANPAAVSLIGIPEEKLLGSNFTKLFFKTQRKRIKNLLDGIGDKPEATTEKSPVILNGRQVSADFLPVKDEDQKFIIVIFKDITERKLAEKKIKGYAENLEEMVKDKTRELNQALNDTEEERDKIDGILKSVADGLVVTDTYNRVILMNRAAENLFDINFSEVINRPVDFAVLDKNVLEQIKTALDRKESGYRLDFEWPGKDTDHPRILRARTAVILDKNRRHTGNITIVSDVTHEREIDRMKNELITTVAHELRTPLTSILGFSEILLKREDIGRDEQKNFLSHINAKAIGLTEMANDFLEIFQAEFGSGFVLNKAPLNIGETVKQAVADVQKLTQNRQIEIILPDKPVILNANKEKIGRVLKNILSNAIKFSPEGGPVCLTVKVISDFGVRNAELEGHEKQSEIEISIADQGIGMRLEQIEKIFDKFYRADTSNAAIEGTGLSMTIAKHIIEAHNGKVWVDSELGKGTTVRCTIPA